MSEQRWNTRAVVYLFPACEAGCLADEEPDPTFVGNKGQPIGSLMVEHRHDRFIWGQ